MTARIRFFFIVISILFPEYLFAQAKDTVGMQSVNKKKLRTYVISSSIAYAGSMVGLSELWYKNSQQQSFRFFNDNTEWKQVDKIGHFYSAFQLSKVNSHFLRSCNVAPKRSDLIGAITGFMIMAPIEIFDGFSNAYGASVGDLLADAGGSVFFLAQSYAWKEVRIHPKFSFHQTDYASIRPGELGHGLSEEWLKDYNGQTYWLSFDMDKFLRFPKWLNLAAGYGAQGMVYALDQQNRLNGYDPYRQYYLSIDFDLTCIKTKSKVLKTLIYIVNMIKLPAPALEFSRKGTQFHVLYF